MSSEYADKEVNLDVIREGNDAEQDSLIAHSAVLIDFANAIVGARKEEVAATRNALAQAMGEPAMIEAAAVASNFQRMVRIADSTGIPLGRFEEASASVRRDLGLEDFLEQKHG